MKHLNKLFFFLTLSCITLTVTAQWQPKSTGVNSGVIHCFIESSGVLFAGGNNTGIYSSTNNGNSWSTSNIGITSGDEILCFGKNSAGLFAADKTIYFSNNNGTSWSPVNTGGNYTFSLAFLGDTVFAPSFTGGVRMSADNGATWVWVNTGLPSSDTIAYIISVGNLLFTTTYNNGVFMSSNAGASWSAVNNGLSFPYKAYNIVSNGAQLFVVTNNGLYTSSNYGALWTKVSSVIIGSITFVGNTMIANAGNGRVVRSTDGGVTWTNFTANIDTTCTGGIAGFYVTAQYVFCGVEGGCLGPVYRINRSEVLSVDEVENDLKWSLYPNPFNNIITIDFEKFTHNKLYIQNLLGEKILELELTKATTTINLNNLPAGVYTLTVFNNQSTATKKVVKQ